MKLLDLTMKDVDNILLIITDGSESIGDNVGKFMGMTQKEFNTAEGILTDFYITLRELVEKQNLKEKNNVYI